MTPIVARVSSNKTGALSRVPVVDVGFSLQGHFQDHAAEGGQKLILSIHLRSIGTGKPKP